MKSSRRRFLFGGLNWVNRIGKAATVQGEKIPQFVLRPPGAIQEEAFVQACRKDCLQCLISCPVYAIQKIADPNSAAYHTAYIDPQVSGCSFCEHFPCIKACPHGVLVNDIKPMGVAEVLDSCVTKQGEFCEICLPSCPANHQSLFKDKKGVLQVDREKCVGCGSCVSSCFLLPKAIRIDPADRYERI